MKIETKYKRKVVLIYPRFPKRLPALSLAMGPFYIGSYLINEGYEVVLLDANNFSSGQAFLTTLRENLDQAAVVGLSVMTAQIPDALTVSAYVKQVAPSTPVVWGGVHPSLFPEQTAKYRYVDYAVRGEGEIVFLKLLKALEGQSELSSLKGIAFKSDNDSEVTEIGGGEIPDINKLPPLRWDLLETIKPSERLSLPEIAGLSGRGVYLQTSRGCPHRCTFCINSVLDVKFRDRRSDLVLDDIQRLVNAGVHSIWFTDEIFFANKKRVLAILEGIEERDLKFRWFADIRADYFNPRHIDSQLILRMKLNGCEVLGIGAESGSQRILDMLKKDIKVENTINAAETLNRAGIKATFSFMTGLPEEEKDDILKTLNLIIKITNIDSSLSFRILGPQVYRPYPGSELYYECIRQGMKEPASIEEWATSPYIKSETIINPDAYPWIKHPADFINNVAFYGGLSGIQLQYDFITRTIRKIASLRCRRLSFKFPVEKWAYNLLMKTGAYKLLRIRNVLKS